MRIGYLLLASLFLVSCSPDPPSQENMVEHKRLDGVHTLRKVFPTNKVETISAHGDGSYFLIGGSFEYRGEQKVLSQSVRFAWEDGEDHAYSIASVPLDMVRIQINDSQTNPMVYFHWHEGIGDFDHLITDTSSSAFRSVDEVTFICNSHDWPTDIQMPMNDGGKR